MITIHGRGTPSHFMIRFVACLLCISVVFANRSEAAPPLRSEMQRLTGALPLIERPHPDLNYNFDFNREAFYVYVPPNYDGSEPFGLLVFIYSRNAYTIPRGWLSALEERKLVYVSPQNVGNGQPMSRRCGISTVAALKLKERLNIDPDRVYVSGYSGGGWAACRTAFFHDDIFKGVIPICGVNFHKRVKWIYTEDPFDYGFFYLDDRSAERTRERVRFSIITGSGDHRRNPIRDVFHGGYKQFGFDAKLFDVPGMGHTICSPQVLLRALDFLERPGPVAPSGGPSPRIDVPEPVALIKRNWKSESGYEMPAELLKVEGEMATLRQENGRIVEIEVSKFASPDQEILRAYLDKRQGP